MRICLVIAVAAAALFARPVAAEPGAAGPRAGRVIYVTSSITVLEDIEFNDGEIAIPRSLIPVLDAVASTIRANPELRVVEIRGFADDDGSARRNVALSVGRATAVRNYLVARGVERWRLRVTGLGRTKARKRAVEFVIAARG